MNRDELIKIFNSSITGKKHMDARRIIENDLITDSDISSDEFVINIDSNIISDNLMSSYTCKLELDNENKEILSSYCTCDEYEKFEFSKKNYCCKHLIATFYNSLNDVLELLNKNTDIKAISNDIKSSLLENIVDLKERKTIRFEVYLEKEAWNDGIKAYFKIGNGTKFYTLRDIEQFLVHYYNKIPLQFGKDFMYSCKEQKLIFSDIKIIDFIEMLNQIDGPMIKLHRKDKRLVDGKYIKIPEYLIKTFFNTIKDSKIYMSSGFYSRDVEAFILNENPPFNIVLNGSDDGYTLVYKDSIPKRLNSKNNVFKHSNYIYLADDAFSQNVSELLNIFEDQKTIDFLKREENTIFKYLIPKLKTISNDLLVNNYIKDRTLDVDPIFKFYLDSNKNNLSLKVNICYDTVEFNIFDEFTDKYIFRRLNLENKVIALVSRIGFSRDISNNNLIFNKDEEGKFNFFKSDISLLQKEGDVFYSDKIKGIKVLTSKSFTADIKAGKNNYFDFKFDINGINKNEIINILKSLENNIRYYKLKSGEFIDLENIELKKLYNLIESLTANRVSSLKELNINFNKGKSIFINDHIKDNNIKFISGTEYLNKTVKEFNDFKENPIKLPITLNAKLREYQVHGFKWLKSMKKLGNGAILADEMGLGKTLQAISFLCSEIEENPKSKTLIITPTSLVYNWGAEFDKFTNIKYSMAIGDKKLRIPILEDFKTNDINILITTYGTLKNDLKLYDDMILNHLIIDEAQNIKNSKAISTKTVKSIKADVRFALTGTPVENSVKEIWSLFDFIMPGYFKREVDFNSRYNKNLNEDKEVLDELSKLTRPFILRRYKKDVIKELPDKIIKDIIIPLDSQNKKAYGVFSRNIQNIIENGESIDNNFTKNNRLDILAYITKLRQLCLDPSTVIDNYKGNSTKIDILIDILSEKIEEGHKLLVFSQFTSVLKNISTRLDIENIRYSYLDGSLSAKARECAVTKLKEGESDVFLISTKAGGTGLNLTEADIVIHFDPWWNPAVEDQATDRAHRIGQKNAVEVIRLIAKDTVEEKIIELQDRKRDMINNILNNSACETSNSLDFKDVLNILKSRQF